MGLAEAVSLGERGGAVGGGFGSLPNRYIVLGNANGDPLKIPVSDGSGFHTFMVFFSLFPFFGRGGRGAWKRKEKKTLRSTYVVDRY
jgi:hypothetical protein